jgi:hypothetical protein
MASVQEMIRPGEPIDMYYYSGETSKKSAFPTTQNTKYTQQFNNLTGGANVFTFPPQCGLQHIIVSATIPALGTEEGTLDHVGLASGWLYSLVRSCSFRYGGTSQFLISGSQLLQNTLRDQTSRVSMNDIFNLGGVYLSGDDFLKPNTASIVLRLPHCSASGVNLSLPFPTDCLTQQCQVILELNNVQDMYCNASLGSETPLPLPAACSSLSAAYFQVQQVMFNNMGDALARRVDLSSKAYAFPCQFVQQLVQTRLDNNLSAQTVVLSGFRAGAVQNLQVWLTDNLDNLAPSQRVQSGVNQPYNPLKWYRPQSVEMLYAGDIYARYNNGTGTLFNLLNSNKSPIVDTGVIVYNGAVIQNPTQADNAFASAWVELPFAQALCDEDAHYILLHGKAITNGIINLNNVVVPYISGAELPTPSSAAGWTLNVSYVYSSTLLFSQGSVDYVF